MIFHRAAQVFIIPAAITALHFSPVASAATATAREIVTRVYFTPATPLEQIPLYSLDPAAPGAFGGLENEIDRLYRHATTLPSGPDRRSFETRIYNLEKQLRPLRKEFDTVAWVKLRTEVKNEWLAVQAGLLPLPDARRAKSETMGSAPLTLVR